MPLFSARGNVIVPDMLQPRMARAQVWLARKVFDRFDDEDLSHIRPHHYDRVGDLDVRGYSTAKLLNRAFERSQNAIYSWNPHRPCRSSRVGDIFVLDENGDLQAYVVMPQGFALADGFLREDPRMCLDGELQFA